MATKKTASKSSTPDPEAPMAAALKESASDKEAPTGKDDGPGGDGAVLKDRVSQTDQAFLGATSLSDAELEEAKNFDGTVTAANTARDNSVLSGNSEPRSWTQVYRENATHIDIRQGAKADKPKESK